MNNQTGSILKVVELLVWAVLIVLAVVLIGCGGGDSTITDAPAVHTAYAQPQVRP